MTVLGYQPHRCHSIDSRLILSAIWEQPYLQFPALSDPLVLTSFRAETIVRNGCLYHPRRHVTRVQVPGRRHYRQEFPQPGLDISVIAGVSWLCRLAASRLSFIPLLLHTGTLN
jgi:hypothetical protein